MGLFDDVSFAGGPLLPFAGSRLVVLRAGRSRFHHSLLLRRRLRDVGGVLGPQLISWAVDATGAYSRAFYIIAGIMLVSSIIPFIVRPPKREAGAGAPAEA